MSHDSSNKPNKQYSIRVIKEFFGALNMYCVDASDGTARFSRRMAMHLGLTFTSEHFVEAYLKAWDEVSDVQAQRAVSDEMRQVIPLVFGEQTVQEIFQGIFTGLGKRELLTTLQVMLDHPPPFSLRG